MALGFLNNGRPAPDDIIDPNEYAREVAEVMQTENEPDAPAPDQLRYSARFSVEDPVLGNDPLDDSLDEDALQRIAERRLFSQFD